MMGNITHVFILGSKGIPARYGGFETFVDKLTQNKKSEEIMYHVACLGVQRKEEEYNSAHCFKIPVPQIGSAKAIYYDLAALRYSIRYIKKHKITNAIIYILACRIGPFIGYYKWILKRMGIKLYINPDGNEWKRAKWGKVVKFYWKVSERLMVRNADLLICDSQNIEMYIHKTYKWTYDKTKFIAYGADLDKIQNLYENKLFMDWFDEKDVQPFEYYLVVGRFVPENNYEIIIKEFIKSRTHRSLVLISNIEKNKFYDHLKETTHFNTDNRIKFVGTVYDQDLLKAIRQNAFAYIHGHEVGGTNPSLLEALACTRLNLLLDIGFNREVGGDGAIYWEKNESSLSDLIEKSEEMSKKEMKELESKAKMRIKSIYNWESIVDKYEELFRGRKE